MLSIKKILSIICFALSLLSLIISSVLIYNGYNINSLDYLYPSVYNLNVVLALAGIGFGFAFAAVAFSVWIAFSRSGIAFILKAVFSVICCFILILNSALMSMCFYFESRTDNIDYYLCFDEAKGPIEEIDGFFPSKDSLLNLESKGNKVKYSYRFMYPAICDMYEYSVSLNICFNEKAEFDKYWQAQLSSSQKPATHNGEDLVILIGQYTYENIDSVLVSHKIVANEETLTVSYYAEAEIVS